MKQSGGFTLVSAIFLMVVLVVLGASLVTLSSVQHHSSALQGQTLRATYAARTGLEWATAQVSTWAGGCPATTNWPAGTLGGTLSGFMVVINCTSTAHTLGGVNARHFLVTVTASAGNYGTPDYVARTVQTKLMSTP